MRLAVFAPMAPDRTGIATYATELALALARRCEVRIFTQTTNALPVGGLEMVHFPADPWSLKSLAGYDHILYHVGNNPWYHQQIRHAHGIFPGSVVLHDMVLYFLAAGFGRGALLKELLLADPAATPDLARIEADCIDGHLLRYRYPSRHPSIHGLLERTAHFIVHNRTTANALAALGYKGRIDVVPLMHYELARAGESDARGNLRAEMGYSDKDFVLGAFGFIGATKRLDQVMRAMASLRDRGLGEHLRLLIVGEGDSLDGMVAELGLGEVVRKAGYVPDEQFRAYLGAIDALANLRFPSHGESSASLIQAMAAGCPCIVTDDAWFSELPDGVVAKVGHGETEVDEIAATLQRLAADPSAAAALGEAGRRHVTTEHSPDLVASRYLDALAAVRPAARPAPTTPDDGPFTSRAYLAARTRQLIP